MKDQILVSRDELNRVYYVLEQVVSMLSVTKDMLSNLLQDRQTRRDVTKRDDYLDNLVDGMKNSELKGINEQDNSELMVTIIGGTWNGDMMPVSSMMPIGAKTILSGEIYERTTDGLEFVDKVKEDVDK